MKPEDVADPDDHTTETTPARKPYQKPRLEVYGDLADITKSQAAGTKNDGAVHPNKHFTS